MTKLQPPVVSEEFGKVAKHNFSCRFCEEEWQEELYQDSFYDIENKYKIVISSIHNCCKEKEDKNIKIRENNIRNFRKFFNGQEILSCIQKEILDSKEKKYFANSLDKILRLKKESDFNMCCFDENGIKLLIPTGICLTGDERDRYIAKIRASKLNDQ
jgi:hypothetical protein